MSSEDIISELVNSVKELSEKNFSLALKVNELESKIVQVDQNKKELASIKTGLDAATTDRTAIKDLLNLKINEVKNTLDERISSIKNDIVLVKEDLNHLGNDYTGIKQNLVDLHSEIEKVLKQMSSETIKNLETIRSIMDQKITNNTSTIANLQKELESKSKEFNDANQSTNTSLQEKINELTNSITNLSNEFSNKLELAQSSLTEGFTKGDTETRQLLETNQEQNTKKIDEAVTSLQNDLKNLEDTNNALFEKTTTETANELQQMTETVNKKFDDQHSLLTNLSSQTDMNLNTVRSQIDKFFDITDNHSQVLQAFEQITGQIHGTIERASLEVKKDQELLLESFQKIIVGQAENLRNELLTFSKEIRTNLSKFNELSDSQYTSKDETNKISEKIKSLDEELRSRSENIRKELITTVEESVQKFNTAIKESISSVDEYRVDLERFKDDIESLVERKVNEKNEFSMELFNNLLTKAEHISKLIHESKITSVPPIAFPIPEIKNSERKTE